VDLIIVESPSKIKKIKQYAENITKRKMAVYASLGHIGNFSKEITFDHLKKFDLPYTIDKAKMKNLKNILEAAKKASAIYIATDPDREGEAIGYRLKEYLKKNKIPVSKIKRINLNEITENGVKQAFKNIGDIDMNMVHAQIARSASDQIIGFIATRMLWVALDNLIQQMNQNKRYTKSKSKGSFVTLSAGRVQIPALKFIYDREHTINNFKPESYVEIELVLNKNNIDFNATRRFKIGDNKTPVQIYQKYSKLRKITALNTNKSQKKLSPPPPYQTQSAQSDIVKIFKVPVKTAQSILQSLYEKGFITYHRTDSTRVSDEGIAIAKEIINKIDKNLFEPHKGRAGEQDAHEAIRVTHAFENTSELNDLEKKVYNLIRDRFITSQMKPMIYNETVVNFEDDFKAIGISIIDKGFTAYAKSSKKENIIPDIKNNEVLPIKKIEKLDKQTQPPEHFTVPTLLAKLKASGIGRPSTYAYVVDTLFRRNYVTEEKDKLFITDTGREVIKFLYEVYPIKYVYPEYTAEMEKMLDDVSNGKLNVNQIKEHLILLKQELEKKLSAVQKAV
jgi:DNA topoisomerase-1